MVVIRKKGTEDRFLLFHRDLSEKFTGWWLIEMPKKQTEKEAEKKEEEVEKEKIIKIPDETLVKEYEFAGNLV